MSEHVLQAQLEAYRDRTLPPADLLRVSRHLEECAACGEQLRRIIPLPGALFLSHEYFHLSDDEHIAPYVNGSADEVTREIVESHVEYCEECADLVNDIIAFKETLVHPPTESPSTTTPPSLWIKLTSWLGLPQPRLSFATAVALVVAAVISIPLLLIYYRSGYPSGGTRLTDAGQESNDTASSPQPSASPAPDLNARDAGAGGGQQPALPSPPDSGGAKVLVTIKDNGRLVTLDSAGVVKGLGTVSPAYQGELVAALTTQRLPLAPGIEEVTGVRGELRNLSPSEQSLSLSAPVGTFVRSTRPTFRWRPLGGAASYTVKVLDSDYNTVASSPPLTGTEWTPSDPLQPGKVYSWQVEAMKDGEKVLGPSAEEPEAKFKTLGQEQLTRIKEMEGATAGSRLLRGLLYAREGLLDESEREFRALAGENPGSPTARRLLDRVRSRHARRADLRYPPSPTMTKPAQ